MSGVFEEKYFCAVNSGAGFVSYYNELIKKAERVFIIKGGPGTGKSSFMRKIAESAKRVGKRVVSFYCSSDPESLDAILIDGKILFLDGTAPHSVDTEIPGARDSIIDLGAFWDSAALIGQRNCIRRLSREKRNAFAEAYHYLAAAKETVLARDASLSSLIFDEKIRGAADRCLARIPKEKSFDIKKTVTSSFGMKGSVSFNTLKEIAAETVSVSDHFGTSHIFFDHLIDFAEKKKLSITVSRDPLIPERADAVLINGIGRLYYRGNGGDKHVNMMRFIDTELLKTKKSTLKHAQALITDLTECAVKSFKDAARYHFELEKIYGGAMDFAAKEEFTDNFLTEMFD